MAVKKMYWQKGNTIQLSFSSKLLGVKQSNLDRLVKNGSIRKVKVPFERYERIPVIDVIAMLQKEHAVLSKRKSEIEKYHAHLGEALHVYLELNEEDKNVRDMDVQNLVEKLQKL